MKALKDFFYDKNDILVAFIILLLAALIVFWRVGVIMEYPEKIVAEASSSVDAEGDNIGLPPVSDPVTTGNAISSQGGIDDPPIDTGSEDIDICAVYVNYGEALEVVAQNCVTAGLIGSVDEFMTLINEMGVASSIQAGQHHIPSNVTPEELINYLLQPGL